MPKLLAGQRLRLTRFWIPFRSTGPDDEPPTVHLHDGILPDPEDKYGRLCNPTLQTLHDIQQKRCFALLGQPGLGKTLAIEQWVDELRAVAAPADEIIPITGRSLATYEDIRNDTVLSREWKRARTAGGDVTLIIDGLDEALQRLPVLLHRLHKCLKDEPPQRTRLAFISRVADWRASGADQIFALWPANERAGAFELVPLRWRDVREAVSKSNLSAHRFQQSVIQRRVSWMAGRPKLLLMLLEEFKLRRRLPDSRNELFMRAAQRMCEEHDPERQQILERSQRAIIPSEQLFVLVERIAAILLMTGKTHILFDREAEPKASDVQFADLCGGSESLSGEPVNAEASHIAAALDTGHFVAAGPGRLCLDHQQMGEFMAARYLSRCTEPQLRNLLTQRVDGTGYLAPQFREIVAWIATAHRRFQRFVIEHEPRLLVEADTADLDDATRAAVVGALLAQLASGEANDRYLRADLLRSLRHPELTRQLRPYVEDSKHNVVVRRTAMWMAGAARCIGLKALLWKIVEDQTQGSLRHSAVDAIAEMASAADAKHFTKLLRNNAQPDGDEELKGQSLLFLVPKYFSVASMLKFLTPRDENRVSAYYNALEHHLPKSIRRADVRPILRAYASREKRAVQMGQVRPLAVSAVKFALRRFEDTPIRLECLRFLSFELQNHQWEGTWEAVKPRGCSTAVETQWRRALIESFVKRAQGRVIAFFRFGLLPQAEDFAWVLQHMRTATGTQLIVWAQLARRLAFAGIPARIVEQFQQTYDATPAFRKQLPTPRKHDLFETLRRRARASELWHELWRRRTERRQAQEAKGKLTLDEAVERLRSGDLAQWTTFTRVLNRHELEAQKPRQRSYDIASWAVWAKLQPADQKLALDVAVQFLCGQKMPIRESQLVYYHDRAAVLAMVLVGNRRRRGLAVRAAIKRTWIPAILGELYNGEPELQRIACLAYELAPQECIAWCKDEIRKLQKHNSSFHSLRAFKDCWDRRLTTLVSEVALNPREKPRAVLYALALLRDVSASDARKVWKQIESSTRRASFNQRARLITFLGLTAFSDVGWDGAMARYKRQTRRRQIRMFAEHVRFLSYDFRHFENQITEQQLASLYEVLSQLFPPAKLRDYARGGSVRARDHLADLQRACLNILVERATTAARSELRRLTMMGSDENRLWMKWRLRDAIDQTLRTRWVDDYPTASAIKKIVRVSEALRVRDSEELQQAAMCSLARLQSAMHVGEFPKLLHFWQDRGQNPKAEREVARSIAEWLRQDLRGDQGLVVDREPQVGFSGQLDLKIECPAVRTPPRPRLIVVIEVKNCVHPHVATAAGSQLSEGYLRRKSIQNGIYLVAWFDVPASVVHWESREEATRTVAEWAKNASTASATVTGLVLDCRWMQMESPSSLAAGAHRRMRLENRTGVSL